MGMRKYGTPQPIAPVDEQDPQGLNVTAAREEAEAQTYDPNEVIEEGEGKTE